MQQQITHDSTLVIACLVKFTRIPGHY